MATTKQMNMNDLDVILEKIKIAEAHSAGTALTTAIMDSCEVLRIGRQSDADGSAHRVGTMNTRANPDGGATGTPFPRITDPLFENDTDGGPIVFDGLGPMAPLVQGNYGTLGNWPVPLLCRPKRSFKPPSVQKRLGFSIPVLSAAEAPTAVLPLEAAMAS